MKKQYMIGVFFLCFFVWAIVVDNAVIPSVGDLQKETGTYSRYRVKEWKGDGKIDILKDELLVYAYIKDREHLYYMERTTAAESSLRNLEPGTPVQMSFAKRFPKVWKRHLYIMTSGNIPVAGYSSAHLEEKQMFIWKFSGIIGGIFIFLVLIGLINKPGRR